MRGRRIAFHHAEKARIVHHLSIGDFRSILIETPMKDRRIPLGASLVHWHGNDDLPRQYLGSGQQYRAVFNLHRMQIARPSPHVW